MRSLFLPVLLSAALFASPAQGAICAAAQTHMAATGRVFGHLSYGDAAPGDLVAVPAHDAMRGCRVHKDMLPDLERMLAAAEHDPAVKGRLLALSCHRSVLRQAEVFCRGGTQSAAERAISVAPPGHSEHATGYAVDFAVRPANGCPDAEACMAATPAARWLRDNGPRYGFELSFPGGNAQQVKWEPWHWRWVGATATAPGAARARFVFARARDQFPADPAVDPTMVVTDVTPVAFVTVPVWTPPKVVEGKKRRKTR